MHRLFSTFCIFSIATNGLAADSTLRFNRDVRPILSDTCFHCHGPDKNSRKGGLRLDLREDALKPAKSGAIPIVPGKPDESEAVNRLFTTDEDDLMPPPEAHKVLTAQQKKTLRDWIAQGAIYEPHWAYTPLTSPPVPEVKTTGWALNPIDNFIQQRLEAQGIKPSASADKATLLRRLSLDLIGLPPTPGEVATFVADTAPEAWDRQIERLMASPHFGERWAVWWLDVARFSDTVGYHGDQNARNFPYRDYVISAFNSNKPLDQFTTEQLAGDLIPNPTPETLTASGFNRLNMVTREGGAQAKEYLAKYGADRVRTVGTAFLGSTFGCAECHDHKFDPISTKDFYSLQAFFADIKQWGVYSPYNSSPNEELKGFNNDYPFPPEILVDSPFLTKKATGIRTQMQTLAKANCAADKANAWKTEIESFLKKQPSGWIAPTPSVATSAPKVKKGKAKPAAAGKPVAVPAPNAEEIEESAFSVSSDGTISFRATAADDTTITLTPAAGNYAALRLDLFPTPDHKDSILRNGGKEPATINLALSLKKPGAKSGTGITIHHAEADRYSPRYSSGAEIIGVQGGWSTSAKEWNQPHAAVYLFTKPITVAEGDNLVVSMSKNMAGSFRLSLSPMAIPSPATSPAELLTSEALAASFLSSTNETPPIQQQLQKLHHDLLACRSGKAYTLVSQAVANPLTVRVLHRGNWMDETGEMVTPQTPHFLPQLANSEQRRLTRLDLAKWICSDVNPLTRRTFANRVWKQFFGNALSIAPDDLGAQGEAPSHPELLDWLAVQFSATKWDFKKILRQIVTSATYQQSSSLRPELKDIDPLNRLLASQNPRRLDAEFVRDNALAISGLLNRDLGGPSIKPYQPAGYYANLQFPDRNYVSDTDEGQYRRGVYMHWQRTFLHPMLANFDAPMRDECIAARGVSNTPQQALTLLNDPSFTEAARVFAENTRTGDIQALFERALGRRPKQAEAESLAKFHQSQLEYFKAHPDDAAKLQKVGLKPAAALTPEAAAWTATCRVVLNLHETMTRY